VLVGIRLLGARARTPGRVKRSRGHLRAETLSRVMFFRGVAETTAHACNARVARGRGCPLGKAVYRDQLGPMLPGGAVAMDQICGPADAGNEGYGVAVRIGMTLPMSVSDGAGRMPAWTQVLEVAQHAEAAGLDSAWVCDHLLSEPPWQPQNWVNLQTLAAATGAPSVRADSAIWRSRAPSQFLHRLRLILDTP
jgi:Luciferase-like monooxygenase